MKLLDSKIYLSDIQRTSASLNWLKKPTKKTFLVTGASGLICSSVIDLLEELNISEHLDWKFLIPTRNIKKTKERFSNYEKYGNISYFEYDILEPICFPKGIDYIIHGAGNAYPSIIDKKPVETLIGCTFGVDQILNYTRGQRDARLLYVSSSEVYGILQNIVPIKENEYGYIDILNHRASYSIGKRAAETLCLSYVSEFNSDCVIVRPGHIYGPTAGKNDNRVSSSFMYTVAMGKNLIMKSEGKQIRSYCYCLDCASAIIVALFMGKSGEAYNISNKNSICTIKEMAMSFSSAGNVSLELDIPTELEKRAFNPMLNSSLNSEKIESLGWNAEFSKEEGFEHSVLICKELLK